MPLDIETYEIVIRIVKENLKNALILSGNAINSRVPCYIGSQAHQEALARQILDELNKEY